MLSPAGLPGYAAVAQKLGQRIAEALASERRVRESKGEMPARRRGWRRSRSSGPGRPAEKHFQEVLSSKPQTRMIDEALRNWVGLSGAATAFVIYFGCRRCRPARRRASGSGRG